MRPHVVCAVLVATLCWASVASATETGTCRGLKTAAFEHSFPTEVRRYDFAGDLVAPFIGLWESKPRPTLAVAPEQVRVYAVPGRPYLIGYEVGGCLIGLLRVSRRGLDRWLRPRFGHPV